MGSPLHSALNTFIPCWDMVISENELDLFSFFSPFLKEIFLFRQIHLHSQLVNKEMNVMKKDGKVAMKSDT